MDIQITQFGDKVQYNVWLKAKIWKMLFIEIRYFHTPYKHFYNFVKPVRSLGCVEERHFNTKKFIIVLFFHVPAVGL